MITSRVLTVSAIAALAASSLFFAGRYALGESPKTVAVTSVPERSASPSVSKTPAVKIKTQVLLVSRALLEKVEVKYDLKVPMHHVRPDTAETMTGATLISETTAGELLKVANAGPGNLEFSP